MKMRPSKTKCFKLMFIPSSTISYAITKIETISSKKQKIPNEFSICNYLNVNTDKDILHWMPYQIPTRKWKIKKRTKKRSELLLSNLFNWSCNFKLFQFLQQIKWKHRKWPQRYTIKRGPHRSSEI